MKLHKAHYAIMSEPRVLEGWKGKIRLMQSWLTEAYYRKHAMFILAIGRNGKPWFKFAGYNEQRIFSFAYFVSPPVKSKYLPPTTKIVRIGYLGRFVKMKGIFDLAKAVGLLSDVSVEFVGSGAEENLLREYCDFYKLDCSFAGVLPIAEIGTFFNRIDVLVLASTSTDDGWGVVVSEALMSGVAVVASYAVGASLVLERRLFGRCVPPSNPACIAGAISDLQDSDAFTTLQRQLRSAMATNLLSANAGADYLIDVIKWSAGKLPHPHDFYSK